MTNMNISEETMCGMGKTQFKSIVRKSVMSAVFDSLKVVQLTHTKVRYILYPKFELQPYLQSDLMDSEEIALLFNMRADTINGYKMCFSSVNQDDTQCKLKCNNEDSISHAFKCHVIKKHVGHSDASYVGIYGNVKQQKDTVSYFITIQNIRSTLLAGGAYQGHTATPAPAGEAGEAPG